MAVETQAPPQEPAVDTPAPAPEPDPIETRPAPSDRRTGILQRASRYGLAITLTVSLIANAIAVAMIAVGGDSDRKQLTPEVALGTFGFVSSQAESNQVVKAEFNVHVALSEDVEKAGRQRMTEREFRLRQDLEELLRGAHSGDFDDPLLRSLKERLKERIDKTLGIRAVAYVIITALETERKPPSAAEEEEEPSVLVPWVESSAE